ncbi:MAG TPA: hypothetical protein VHE81_16780 [Lacipirellulaceae bacterium]|nr:hypothetical protein [Lacipirellulaceae bacterium]
MPRNNLSRVLFTAVAGSCAMVFAGCATWQGPRIDPTGERLLIWPNEQPAAVVAPPVPSPVAAPPGAAVVPSPAVPVVPQPAVAPPPVAPNAVPPNAPLPFGNVQAPPVYSDPPMPPVAPPPAGVSAPAPYIPGAATAPSLPPATVTPAVPIVTPVAGQPPATTVPAGHAYLRLTPDRMIAPVGTQVLLKAGVMGPDGYLATNQRIEWSVARNGVGQLGDMGLNGPARLLGWWQAPERIDNWTAVGNTVYLPVTLDANSVDPNNSWRIERGETWVTLASANEGTSQITARATDQREFNQATSTIYWIDAQWVFPASAVAPQGQPHVLTTIITRRTDGRPLAGWIVRYSVAGGGAPSGSLGYEGGTTTDVPTDATGRASVEVSPTAAGAGVTNVNITIIRPASVGPNALPRVELAHAATTVTWSGAAPAAPPAPTAIPGPPPSPSPLAPPPSMSAPAPPPQNQPAPTLAPSTSAPTTQQPPPYTPPPAASTGKPRLEISLRANGPEQVPVGGYVDYDVTVTNRGDGVARHVELRDRFDPGLRCPTDTQNTHLIKNPNIGDLAPNASQTIKLPFQVVAAGQQCHDVAVAADGVEPVGQHACVTGIPASLNVKVTAPVRRVVGETVDFSVAVKNVSASAATNVELRFRCDPAIELTVEGDAQRLSDGSLLVRLDRGLAANEQRVLPFHGQCKKPSDHACARAAVTALGGVNSEDEACLQILAPYTGTAPGNTAP